MRGSEDWDITESLYWLRELEIPSENIEENLQRCLGCCAAETLEGEISGVPGDKPLHQLLTVGEFDVSDYRGDPVLALAMQAALHSRGLEHRSLTRLAQFYADVVISTDSGDESLHLVRSLLSSAGFSVPVAPHRDASPDDEQLGTVEDRSQLISFCNRIGGSTIWGSHEIDTSDMAHLLPPLTLSYALDWDLEAVCILLRTCGYLGLAGSQSCLWAQEWLIEQHHEGRFGLILPECQISGRHPEDRSLFFLPTVSALWTLAEVRCPGFLLGLTHSRPYSDAKREHGPARPTPMPQMTWKGSTDSETEIREIAPSKMSLRPLGESRFERHAIKPGLQAPSFKLADIWGRGQVSLIDYRGRSVLLVFIDPNCQPCDEVIRQLVDVERKRLNDGSQILLVSRGDPAANDRKLAAHGATFPAVLQPRWTLSKQYGIFSFPAAFLIDKEGFVARDVARGSSIVDLLTT